jgi:hypothetical protein
MDINIDSENNIKNILVLAELPVVAGFKYINVCNLPRLNFVKSIEIFENTKFSGNKFCILRFNSLTSTFFATKIALSASHS